MEILSANVLIPLMAAMVGSQGLMAAALIAIAFRVGRLPTREEYADLRKEVTNNKEELRREATANKEELRREATANKEELRREIEKAKNEVLQEIRRSHQQIMLALANHTHDDNGRAVFTLPPDVELVPAPADN